MHYRPFDPLRPTAEPQKFAVLTGDPGKALLLAQKTLKKPKMFNHHHGLWGYVGECKEGFSLLIQSTGFGGPSAAAVVQQLTGYGVEVVIRAGTCRPLTGSLEDESLITPETVVPEDGTSKTLGATNDLDCHPQLTTELMKTVPRAVSGSIISTDMPTPPDHATHQQWIASGAIACDMSSAAIMQVAQLTGLKAACILSVSARSETNSDPEETFAAGEAAVAAIKQFQELRSVLRFSGNSLRS